MWNTAGYRKQYVGVLGSATAQQVVRKNNSAWQSFFAARENDEDTAPPGHGVTRTTAENSGCVSETSSTRRKQARSRLEIPVGQALSDEYGRGYHERLRLDVCGARECEGEQGRLEIRYDEGDDTFRPTQPVTAPSSRQDSPLASHEAALGVGANTLVACTATTGQQYCYDGRAPFDRFRETTEEITRLQFNPREGRHSSTGYGACIARGRDGATTHRARSSGTCRNDCTTSVATVYVGDLTGVLSAHWLAEMNKKIH